MTLREILEAFYSIGNGTIPLWEIFDEQEAKGNCLSNQVTIRSEKVGFHRFSTTYKISYLLGEYILLAEKDYEEAVTEVNNWKDLIQNR